VDAAHLELLPKGEPRHGLATMRAFSVDLFKPLKLWIPARLEESVTICRIWVGDDQRTVYSGPTPAWAFQHAALGIPSLMPGEQIAVEIQLPIRKQGVTKVPELAMGFVGRSRPAPKGERPRHPSDPSRVVALMNGRAPKTHKLKTWPSQFLALRNGEKTCEFRKNDRDFQVGDGLVLCEWVPGHAERALYGDETPNPGRYTNDVVTARVTHIVFGTETPFGIPPGYAMLSIVLTGAFSTRNVIRTDTKLSKLSAP
jgi:hypothetical protein